MNIGKIVAYDNLKSTLSIESSIKNVSLGDSICCSGVCLTIMNIKKKIIEFNISTETKQKTNLMNYNIGDLINLEKSLKVGDEINGHFVFGHVDGLSRIEKIKHLKDSKVLEFYADKNIMKFLSPKCSIAVASGTPKKIIFRIAGTRWTFIMAVEIRWQSRTLHKYLTCEKLRNECQK